MTDINLENKSTSPETEVTTVPSKKAHRFLIVIVCISIFLSLCVSALGFYLYQNNLSSQNFYNEKIYNLKTDFQSTFTQQNKQMEDVKRANENLTTQLEQVNSHLLDITNKNKLYSADVQALQRSVAETNIRHPNDWILSEVEYLINLSGRKLWLEHDLTSSIALLSAADQRVVEMKDPSLNPLRRALLEDINMLEGLPNRDLDKVVLALSSLETRIDDLVVFGLDVPEVNSDNHEGVSSDVGDWKANLGKSWDDFVASFIVVSHHDEPIEALLSPEQAWYLKENLRNHLSRAEFAVYREQQGIYDNALKNTLQLLDLYYDKTDKVTQQFQESIKRLAEQKISITYPDQYKSAPLLAHIVKQRLSKSLMTEKVE